MQPFVPLVRNPHLLTILGNFWPRTIDEVRFPPHRRIVETEPGVSILVISQMPEVPPRAHLILVHGLEGSSDAGYKRSMAQHALESGIAVHRFNMRSCGGTEELALTNYHAGQTSDLLFFLRSLRSESPAPIFLTGFSLGGNVVLKLAGELDDAGPELLAGVCAVSTPLDLAACVELLRRPANFIYEWRFLSRLKERIRKRAAQAPDQYSARELHTVHTVYDFDDRYTAPPVWIRNRGELLCDTIVEEFPRSDSCPRSARASAGRSSNPLRRLRPAGFSDQPPSPAPRSGAWRPSRICFAREAALLVGCGGAGVDRFSDPGERASRLTPALALPQFRDVSRMVPAVPRIQGERCLQRHGSALGMPVRPLPLRGVQILPKHNPTTVQCVGQ